MNLFNCPYCDFVLDVKKYPYIQFDKIRVECIYCGEIYNHPLKISSRYKPTIEIPNSDSRIKKIFNYIKKNLRFKNDE